MSIRKLFDGKPLVSGVKAQVWFSKAGVKTPDFYAERVKYIDNDYPEK